MTRRLSWALAALALVVPYTLAWYGARIDAAAQRTKHEFICGTPMVAMFLAAALAASLLSSVAVGMNLWSRHATRSQLTAWRIAELVLLASPLLVSVCLVVIVITD